jgi:hypothetical protein
MLADPRQMIMGVGFKKFLILMIFRKLCNKFTEQLLPFAHLITGKQPNYLRIAVHLCRNNIFIAVF